MPSTLHEQLNLLIKGGDPNIPQLPLIAGALGKLADDQGGLPSTVARIASALDKQGDLRQPIPRIVDALEKLADHEAGLPATVKRIASALEKLAERDSLLQPPPAYDDGGRGADERWE
jgi:hypothetical protein